MTTKRRDKTSSVDVFNKLMAENISKRFSPKLKRLPSPDERFRITDDSLNVELNDTFDKLRIAPNFNKVNCKEGSIHNCSSTSESERSRSKLKLPSFNIETVMHSPIPKKKRQNLRKTDVAKKVLPTVEKQKKEATLDRPLVFSLEIERGTGQQKTFPSTALQSGESLDKTNPLHVTEPSKLDASYKPLFTDTIRLRLSPTGQITSTPIGNTKIPDPNITGMLSPLMPKSRNQTVLETTYSEIKNWDYQLSSQTFCDDYDTPRKAFHSFMSSRRRYN